MFSRHVAENPHLNLCIQVWSDKEQCKPRMYNMSVTHNIVTLERMI